jgi:2',3'-cyclic-nucleotide 2'-phosphodiesterase/3'-nucleotidase/5'-nucleotidase
MATVRYAPAPAGRRFRGLFHWSVLALALTGGTAAPSAGQVTRAAPGDIQGTTSHAAPRTLDLLIAATTDVHGRVRGWDYYANASDAVHGLSRAATIVDSVRAANPGRVLLVDAGDLLQGNPFTYVAARVTHPARNPVIAAMNAMRYDAAVVGNHEFNYGVPYLDGAAKQAHFPLLASNVRHANGVPHFPSTATFVRGGVRVAVIGATTPGSDVWDTDHLKAAGLTVIDIVPSVRAAVQGARAKGAQVIVVVLHSGLGGLSSYDTLVTGVPPEDVTERVAREVDGIDVIIFGHSHREVIDTTINGALVIQPKNWATTVGIATLSLEAEGSKWIVKRHRGRSVAVAGHAESPAVLAATSSAHRSTLAWVTSPVGQMAETWRSDSARVKDTPVMDFMLEVMRREAHADLAASAAFALDARIDSGKVTLSELSRLYPYDNTLRAVRLSGKQLRSFLNFSAQYYRTINANGTIPAEGAVNIGVCGYNFDIVAGANYVIDLRKPAGERITELSVNGKIVRDDDTFTMALNNYRQTGGGGYTMLTGAPVTFPRDVDIRQLLIDEVKRKGTLRRSDYFTQNWRIEPASAVGPAFDEQQRARLADAPCGATTTASTASTTGAGITALLDGAPAGQLGKTLRVLTTSDFHAALEARQERGHLRGGAVALEATLGQARSECSAQCTSITVDGGDLFTGTPASDWNSGNPSVAVYNRLGISAGALGNHEFDFGQDTLRARLRHLNYRVLAANVVGTDGLVPSWIKADTIVIRNGLRIGIIGAAAEFTPTVTKRRNLVGLKFLAPAPIISERIKALRAAGVDAVIVTMHEGVRCTTGMSEGCTGSGIDVVKALTEKPDAVVMAHAHTNVLLNINGIPTVQVTSNGRAIGVIDIPLMSRRNTTVAIRDVIGDSITNVDAVTDTIVRNAVARVRTRLERPVGTVSELMKHDGDQYPLGNIMADAARVIAKADFGAWNNGGIRSDLRAGALNFGGVHELTPFGNVLVKLSVRGRDIPALFESVVAGRAPNSHVAGMIINYDSTRAPGDRIVSLTTSDGRALDPNRVYTLSVNDFMLDDVGFIRPALLVSTEVLPIRDDDAITEYLRRLPQPITPPTDVRIRAASTSKELQ